MGSALPRYSRGQVMVYGECRCQVHRPTGHGLWGEGRLVADTAWAEPSTRARPAPGSGRKVMVYGAMRL